MLKIVGKLKPAPAPEVEPEAPPVDAPIESEADPVVAAPDDAMMENEGGKVAPDVARYFGPECRCASCVHFTDPGSCEVVAGPIEARGMCSLYTPDQDPDAGAGMDMPVKEPAMPMPDAPPAPPAAPTGPPMPMKGM